MFPLFLNFRKFTKVLLVLALTLGNLHSAPYGPDGMEIEWTQPGGEKLSLRVFGDEFYGRTETLDGYTVVFDPAKKSYYYADASMDGQELVATGMAPGKGNPQTLGLAKNLDIRPAARKAKAAVRIQRWDEATQTSQRWAELKAQRKAYDEAVQAAKDEGGPMPAPPSFTTVGNKVGLTLLIDFSDDVATIPQANVIDYCNGDNYTGYGNQGSVKKYYQDNSNNLLTYTNTVTAYIRMAQPKSYYNDTTKDSGIQGRLLINDAIDILKALPNYNSEILPNFDTLTVDGSNNIVACNVFYAGGNGGVWSYGLWPHSWSLASAKELSAGGKKVYKYQITNLGTSLTLGTFCHENGHMLCGYPDIYDYDYDSVGGAGGFCLMNSGGHGTNPVLINAYLKRASGWTTTTDLTSSSNVAGTLVATVGHADYNKIYRYANPGNAKEYFIFENRRKTGRDANIAASGIAIWHIDEQGNHNNQSLTPNTTHANYECTLVQADNLWHFQSNSNSGDSKDLYYLGNTAAAYTNTFSDNSAPNAKWWSGAASGLNVYNFSSSGASMTLQFGLPLNTLFVSAPNGGEQIYFNSTQTITWSANIAGNVKIELFKGGSLNSVLAASEANDGSFTWSVSAGLPVGSDYTVKISSVDNPAYTDSSNTNFTITTQPTLADALDTTGLTWTTSGNATWFAQSATSNDGIDAAESGNITHSQSSTTETTLIGPGTMTFWWKVSSEGSYDYLRFYLNNVEQTGSLAKIAGEVDWIQKTVTIPANSQTVKWTYSKDSSVDAGADTAWVDQVVYTPLSAPEIAVEQPVGTNLVDGNGTIDCGVVNLGSYSSPFTFTVKNTGTADLTGLALTKDGTHSADYTLGALGAATLAPGASTTFTVTFTPGAAGARTAAIHIASNDANENPFDINLTGTGVPLGTLAVTPAGNFSSSGGYGGSFSPSSQVYTLSNSGSTSIDWTAAKTVAWVDLGPVSGTLAPGANTTVTASINLNANTLEIGSYSDTVTFTNTTNANGNTTRGVSLTVNPASATVTLGNLNPTYDGNPKPVTVTTTPSGLAHSVTYAGSPTAPTNGGTYTVVATITDPNYTGSASDNLTISKAAQTITFGALSPVLDNATPFALGATASSNLTVSYTSSNAAVATVSGNTVTVTGLGTTTITASQAGNGNYNAATSVPQTLTVVRANPLAVTGGPYKVLIGQTLSLNGSASAPSYGETISTYEWDLNNDNTFGDVTGATPSAITFSSLMSTWSMVQGLNTIQLKITDSSSQTSIVSTTVELVLALTWDANGTGSGQTNGAGAWLGTNLWWDGAANQTWASGSNATFGGPGTAGGAVTLASPTSANSLVFNTFTGTYTLGTAGQTLTINGGINKTATSAAVTISSPIGLGAAQTWTNNSSGLLTASSTLDNGGNLLTVDGSGTTSFSANASSIISGSGGITMNGLGRLQLGSGSAPAHTYSGTTTLNGGLTMIANNNLGTGNLTMNGGVIESYWSSNFIRGLGAGAGQIQITGGTSGFALNGATGMSVILGNNAAIEAVWGSAYFNPSIFVLQTQYSQGTSGLTFANKIDLNGTDRTIQVSGGTTGAATATLSGIIRTSAGTAGIIKTGNGQLNISNANTYNGVTTISAGPLAISNASALGTTAGNTTIAATGSVNGAHLKLSNNITSAENITITGTTEAASYVAAISNTSGTNILSGNIILSSPTAGVRLGAVAGSLTFSGNISQTGTSRYLAFITGDGAALLVNNAIANNGGVLQIHNTTQTTGTGTVTLKGVSGSGIGATSISQTGILKLGVTNTLNTSANLTLGAVSTTAGYDIGTFDLAGFDQTVNALIGSKNTSNIAADTARKVTNSATGTGTNVLTVGNGDGSSTFNGVIVNGATAKLALTKTGGGTQTLAGPNTYTGATTITAGTLALGANNVLPATTAISIANATLDAATFTDTTGTLDVTSTATINLGTGAALAFANSSAIDWTGGTLSLTGTFVSGSSLRFGTSNTGLTAVQLGKISATGIGSFILDPNGFLSAATTVPNVVGLAQSAAEANLVAANLAVGTVTSQNHLTIPAGSVISQSPTGGASVATNSAVDLVVSLGPPTYTVSYNANNATSGTAPADQPKTHDISLTLATNSGNLARTGYTFTGWNTDAEGTGTNYAEGGTYTANTPELLYAKWALNAVAVVTNPSSLSLAEGGSNTFQVKLSAEPAASVTVTVSWASDDSDITVQSGGSLTFTTANWNTYQVVTLAAAEDNADNAAGSATISCSGAGITSAIVIASEIDDDHVLSVSSSNGLITKNPDTDYYDRDSMVQLTAVPDTGYHFTGWSGDASGSENPLTVVMSADKSISANFAADALTITIDAVSIYEVAGSTTATVTRNSATTGALTVSLSSNDPTEASVPATVEIPAGQASAIFSIAAIDDAIIDGTQTVTITATATGHASGANTIDITDNDHLTYSVTYNGNGNTSGAIPDAQTKTDGVNLTLLTNTGDLARTNYIFSGWNTVADGTGTDYAAGGSYSDNAAVTLYAKWIPKTTPTVNTWPTAAAIVQGQALSAATLSGGSASVAGSFGYNTPSVTPSAGIYSAAVTFTPADTTLYNLVEGTVNVTVLTPFDAWANGSTTFNGDSNNDRVLDGLAWLLGAVNPDEYARVRLPSAGEGSSGMVVNFQCLNATKRGSAELRLQYSTDLGVSDPWPNHIIPVPDTSSTVDGVVFVITPIGGSDLLQVQATVPATGDRVFVRLNARLTPP